MICRKWVRRCEISILLSEFLVNARIVLIGFLCSLSLWNCQGKESSTETQDVEVIDITGTGWEAVYLH